MTIDMQPAISSGTAPAGRPNASAASPLATVRALLERERQRVHAAVHDYPMPIPACDADFNALLREREGIAQHIAQLDAAGPDAHVKIAEVIEFSPYLTAELKRTCLSMLARR